MIMANVRGPDVSVVGLGAVCAYRLVSAKRREQLRIAVMNAGFRINGVRNYQNTKEKSSNRDSLTGRKIILG